VPWPKLCTAPDKQGSDRCLPECCSVLAGTYRDASVPWQTCIPANSQNWFCTYSQYNQVDASIKFPPTCSHEDINPTLRPHPKHEKTSRQCFVELHLKSSCCDCAHSHLSCFEQAVQTKRSPQQHDWKLPALTAVLAGTRPRLHCQHPAETPWIGILQQHVWYSQLHSTLEPKPKRSSGGKHRIPAGGEEESKNLGNSLSTGTRSAQQYNMHTFRIQFAVPIAIFSDMFSDTSLLYPRRLQSRYPKCTHMDTQKLSTLNQPQLMKQSGTCACLQAKIRATFSGVIFLRHHSNRQVGN
jgi:hypothetical protein